MSSGDAHIPMPYLRGSIEQRRALLAGLLDTGGTVVPTGEVKLTLTNVRLAHDALELVVSLGYRARFRRHAARGHAERSSTAYIDRIQHRRRGFQAQPQAPRPQGT